MRRVLCLEKNWIPNFDWKTSLEKPLERTRGRWEINVERVLEEQVVNM